MGHERHPGTVTGQPAGRVVLWSNSERNNYACARRGWFAHVEGLRRPETSAMRYGTLWHLWMEEVHRWWMRRDTTWPDWGIVMCPFCKGTGARPEDEPKDLTQSKCSRCEGSGKGVLTRIAEDLAEAARQSQRSGREPVFTDEEAQRVVDTLSRAVYGWLLKYGADPDPSLEVVAVEQSIARVVLNPTTGRPYCPETMVVEEGGELRFAGTSEASKATVVRWPWAQVGRLDAVFRHRRTKVLFVGEWKSSQDPAGMVDGVLLDPQTSGYGWMLEPLVGLFGGSRVVGILYDVASSAYQRDPEPLKGRPTKAEPNPPLAFSQAKATTVPSWRYREALIAAGVDQAPYEDHIDYLTQHVDPRLYLREFPTLGRYDLDRYAAEAFAVVQRLSTGRRDAARATSERDIDVAFPRTPLCRLPGGSCPFRGPCMADGPEVRESFDLSREQRWAP